MEVTITHSGVANSVQVSASVPGIVQVSPTVPIKVELQLFRDGIDGINGKSAYELVVENGYTGTEQDFTNGLMTPMVADFIQNTPSDTWTVNHNTGRKRTLEFFTTGGLKISGDIVVVNENTTIGYFLAPIAGYARVI